MPADEPTDPRRVTGPHTPRPADHAPRAAGVLSLPPVPGMPARVRGSPGTGDHWDPRGDYQAYGVGVLLRAARRLHGADPAGVLYLLPEETIRALWRDGHGGDDAPTPAGRVVVVGWHAALGAGAPLQLRAADNCFLETVARPALGVTYAQALLAVWARLKMTAGTGWRLSYSCALVGNALVADPTPVPAPDVATAAPDAGIMAARADRYDLLRACGDYLDAGGRPYWSFRRS